MERTVMVTVDGYLYSGKSFDRFDVIKNIQAALPTLEATIVIPLLNQHPDTSGLKRPITWKEAIETDLQTMTYENGPVNDPLWVLLSCVTTGKPEPLVYGPTGL